MKPIHGILMGISATLMTIAFIAELNYLLYFALTASYIDGFIWYIESQK